MTTHHDQASSDISLSLSHACSRLASLASGSAQIARQGTLAAWQAAWLVHQARVDLQGLGTRQTRTTACSPVSTQANTRPDRNSARPGASFPSLWHPNHEPLWTIDINQHLIHHHHDHQIGLPGLGCLSCPAGYLVQSTEYILSKVLRSRPHQAQTVIVTATKRACWRLGYAASCSVTSQPLHPAAQSAPPACLLVEKRPKSPDRA